MDSVTKAAMDKKLHQKLFGYEFDFKFEITEKPPGKTRGGWVIQTGQYDEYNHLDFQMDVFDILKNVDNLSNDSLAKGGREAKEFYLKHNPEDQTINIKVSWKKRP